MSFAVGSLVILSSRNIRTLRVSKKLTDKFLELFRILKRIRKNAYKLNLLAKYSRLYYIFHVSLLKAYCMRPSGEPPEP
jgi:hypothetical protein